MENRPDDPFSFLEGLLQVPRIIKCMEDLWVFVPGRTDRYSLPMMQAIRSGESPIRPIDCNQCVVFVESVRISLCMMYPPSKPVLTIVDSENRPTIRITIAMPLEYLNFLTIRANKDKT